MLELDFGIDADDEDDIEYLDDYDADQLSIQQLEEEARRHNEERE